MGGRTVLGDRLLLEFYQPWPVSAPRTDQRKNPRGIPAGVRQCDDSAAACYFAECRPVRVAQPWSTSGTRSYGSENAAVAALRQESLYRRLEFAGWLYAAGIAPAGEAG